MVQNKKKLFGVYCRTCIELKDGYDMIGMSDKSETEQPISLFLQKPVKPYTCEKG